MAKSVSTALMTDIRRGLQTLAVLIQIRRDDGTVYRQTNHDTAIVFQDKRFDHTIPFVLSAFQSGSNLAVDNTELEIQLDGTVFTEDDFRNGAFENAQIEVFQVDFENPDHGRIIMRKGWFGKVEHNKNKVAKIEINGLLKILDFQVGRIYQPGCDADLGDDRCRIAVNMSQHRSWLNLYGVGDWTYWYDTDAMNPLSLVNGQFSADGNVASTDPITGWTKQAGSKWVVNLHSAINGMGDEPNGRRMLEGALDPDPTGEEQYVYQDINLSADVGNNAFIDDGQIIAAFFVQVGQSFYLLDKPRILIEALDATGGIVESHDTGYITLDEVGQWRERALVFNVLPNTRTLRVYLYGLRNDADICNVAFSNVRGYFWNHTVEYPYNDAIHKVTRVRVGGTTEQSKPMRNGSFEANGALSNSAANDITHWTKGVGGFWSVGTTCLGQVPSNGTYFLIGGDSGSGVQETYTISQNYVLVTDGKLDLSRIALGRIVGTFLASVSWGDTVSAAQITLEFYDSLSALVSTYNHLPLSTHAVGTVTSESTFVIPATARTIKVILTARSPVALSQANVAFDNLAFRFYDFEDALPTDPILGAGLEETVPAYASGAPTIDSTLIWKAHSAHQQFDVVATVTDNKQFTGTNITGVNGSFETSLIRWISGDNAGSRNLIRKWDSGTKSIKLYFPTVRPISVGDRFVYIRACQKRFLEDCRLRFDNGVNFQGFPHLPSKLL
jgi:hypothetical protein